MTDDVRHYDSLDFYGAVRRAIDELGADSKEFTERAVRDRLEQNIDCPLSVITWDRVNRALTHLITINHIKCTTPRKLRKKHYALRRVKHTPTPKAKPSVGNEFLPTSARLHRIEGKLDRLLKLWGEEI